MSALAVDSLDLARRAREWREAQTILRDKRYQQTPVGAAVGQFLDDLRWGNSPDTTRNTYEVPLSRLALEFADFASLEEFVGGKRLVETFLTTYWGDSAVTTRQNRLSAIKSFFEWAVGEGLLSANPAARIRRPKGTAKERQSHSHATVRKLINAQPLLRDQIAVQLLGLLGLRKNELRMLRVGDFDLARGEVKLLGKGGKEAVMPLVFEELKRDLYLYLVAERRSPDEFLLHPRGKRGKPMEQSSLHRWFERCCDRAGLSMQMHELRHTAGDMLWRITGDVVKAQQLLRHESLRTTETYLHPRRVDLVSGLEAVDKAWRES